MTKQTDGAVNSLKVLTIFGIILGVIGGVALSAAWPSTEVSTLTGEITETGSSGWALIGLLVAFAGNAMLAVGLVGWGVKLGREASPEPVATQA